METINSALSGQALVAEMRKVEASIIGQIKNMFDNRRKALEAKERDLEAERVVARAAAADGDASENAPLQTAYENISRLTIEITAMKASIDIYDSMQVGSSSTAEPGGVCTINSVVCIQDCSHDDARPTWIIKLYPAGIGNAKVGAIAIDTPLGKALMSHSRGELVTCAAPAGDITYLIKEVI